jgi:surface antigen
VQSFSLRTAALLCALGAAGCASSGDGEYSAMPSPATQGTHVETPSQPVQCVPYARERSGVALYGDAGTWWDKAKGRYAKRQTPEVGAVIVLAGYAGPGRGHVGVVSAVVSQREIRLDHANWLGDGAIYVADPVADVSPENDWSEVRVWNPRTTAWGQKTYVVEGFIGPDRIGDSDRVAAE